MTAPIAVDLPAPPDSVFTPEAAASIIGQRVHLRATLDWDRPSLAIGEVTAAECSPGGTYISAEVAIVKAGPDWDPEPFTGRSDHAFGFATDTAVVGVGGRRITGVKHVTLAPTMGTPALAHICPECATGKHGNCDGTAWSDTLDAPARCECEDPAHA